MLAISNFGVLDCEEESESEEYIRDFPMDSYCLGRQLINPSYTLRRLCLEQKIPGQGGKPVLITIIYGAKTSKPVL